MHDRAVDPVQRMRAEIEQSGETSLEPGELNLLCRGEISDDQRWKMIAEIAINEGWDFTFFPDDSVRFAKIAVPMAFFGPAERKPPPDFSSGGSV